ncbi:MAG: zinc ABC transporter substrate-binding protein [Treponema sp.]|nr:zinc ABC transporter substrate-binding protein [Treponema sp.]
MSVKKISVLCIIALACIVGVLALPKAVKKNKKFSVVTTIFPIYDWAREVGSGNGNIEYTMLLNNGADLHSFQPSVKDIAKVSSADIFIYVGGESDEWVEDVLRTVKNKNLKAINLMDALESRILEEELVEGMQAEEEEEEGEEEEVEYDEHIWLSVKNAALCVEEISRAFISSDESNSSLYSSNTSAYCSKLSDLERQYSSACAGAKNKTLVFADRFPFRYLVKDYGLDYYAAFSGCSAETEASFQTVKFLVDKIDELDLDNIFVIESSDQKLAKTIIENSKRHDRNILVLDSMQSISKNDVEGGKTYLGIMQSNLDQLKKGL